MKTCSSRSHAGKLAAVALAALAGCSTFAAQPDSPTRPDRPFASEAKPLSATPAAPATPTRRRNRATVARSSLVSSARAAEPIAQDRLPAVELTPQIVFQLLASEIAAQRGQIGSATATYLTLAQQTRDPRIARRATELALAERSLDRAIQAARLWRELSPESVLAAQTLESLWLSVGNFADAEPLVAHRLANARDDKTLDEFYQQLGRALVRSSDKAGALAMFDRLSQADATQAEARLVAAALAHSAGDRERAAAEASRAHALRPDDERTAVAAARFVSEAPAGATIAARLLEKFLASHPKSTEARFQYARLMAAMGNADGAREQMELALKNAPDSPPILFSLAQLAYQTKQLKVAEDYLNRYLELPPSVPRDNAPAHLFLAQIDEDQGRPEQAIEHLSKIGRGDQLVPAVTRRAMLLGKLGRVDEARELLRGTGVPTAAERSQLTLAESQVLRDAKRHADAFEVLDQALERSPDAVELLYDHAMAAERIDRLPVMEKSLRRLIELRPDSAHAYNALGYTLADRSIRLDEAQKLIERALKLSPDDAHIIDSMGWVLYRQGRLEEAAGWLERAFRASPEAEIAAHLGEVLWRLGRIEQARKVWADARGREPDNATLRETLARLNVAL